MPGPGKQKGSQKGKGGGFFSNLWGDIKNTAKRTAAAIKQEAVKAADKAGDAFRDAKQAAGQWWDKNKDTVKKVAIGVAAAVVIVGATVLTAGAAAGVMGAVAAGTMGVGAAAASMAVTGAAAAGASAIASTAASSSIRHYNATGSWSGAGQAATKASMEALPGAMAQGALLGGISGYGSALATANNPTGYVSTGGSSKGAWEDSAQQSSEPRGGRAKNNIQPSQNAKGAHTIFKTDQTGKVTNYRTYEPNPQNPLGFDEVLGYDGTGKAHINKATGEALMPHVHDKTVPGGVRVPYPHEIPR